MNKKQKNMLRRIIVTIFLVLLIYLVTNQIEFSKSFLSGVFLLALWMIPYYVIGYDILKKAWKGIINRQVFDENFLMAVATIGAIIVAFVWKDGDYLEAVAVMLFYQIGELFQSYAVGKSRKNISELMDIRPDYANVFEDGTLVQKDPEDIPIGTEIVVKPGEKVPIDGIVLEGKSTLNTSALTGESVPRDIYEGQEVISGCVNMTGLLKIQTTKEFGESTVSKIIDLVENASSKKSRSENFISRFARYYTPAVCYSALALAILPPVFQILFLNVASSGMLWGQWIYRALTFLVISCPCALVISIPLGFFAGIGGAGKHGILVKGSVYLEALAKVKCIVFDKTGTLTQGVFEVTRIYSSHLPEEQVLEYAALSESYSSHPISKSIQKAYGKEIDSSRVSDVEEIGGEGVVAVIDGLNVCVGNDKIMKRFDIPYEECKQAGTVVYVAVNDRFAGYILISDQIKEHAGETISKLKQSGILNTVMLTGDNKIVAESVATELGISKVYSELLPGDKVDKVEELLAVKPKNSNLAFVGDGINDAPVLSRVDVGIAMGAFGSDAAIEAADIVLMDDDPLKIVTAIRIAKKCIGIVYQNIYFAIGVKLLCLVLGAVGIANMWIAIFADVGVMVLAVLNAIRALFIRKI